MSFFQELKKRSVFKVGAGYTVGAWVLIQVADTVLPSFEAPTWILQYLIFLLIIGFPISLILSWAFELTREGIKWEDDADVNLPDTKIPESPPLPLSKPVQEKLKNSIAVLPFENMSPNPDDSYFAAGLHDEILNQLSKNVSLNLIARTSVLQYAGTKKSISEIANELNVEKIMEGSVRYSGDRVRVTTQLIESTTGVHLWSETYERPFNDIFVIESDIAINVAKSMQAQLSPSEIMEVVKAPTNSPAAYSLYLQARLILYAGTGNTDQAHRLLDQAIRLDSQFARAYGLKAMLHAASFINTEQHSVEAAVNQSELEAQVRLWIDRAIAIDPENEEARTAIRTLSIFTWHWSSFEKSMEPADRTRLLHYELWFYSWSGRLEYAVELGEKIVELNPVDAGAYMSLGIVQAYAGQRSASIRTFHKMLEIIPEAPLAHTWLAFNEIALGNNDLAFDLLQLEENLLGDNRSIVFLPELAYCYARIGKSSDAERIIQEIICLGKDNELGAGTWATTYLAAGDEEKALEQLEIVAQKASNHESEQGFLNVMSLRMNHLADPRLNKPEFVDIFSRITGD